MGTLNTIAVFCGANTSNQSVYTEQAIALSDEFLKRGITMVNGGGSVGLMGVMADHMLEKGGRAVGVMPQSIVDIEIAHKGMSDFHVTDSMATRKEKILELSEGFITFPGGPGTLDEFFEVYSWGKLGYHKKPVGVLNVNGYFDPLIAMLDAMVENAFMKPVHRDMVLGDTDSAGLLDRFEAYEAVEESFWIE